MAKPPEDGYGFSVHYRPEYPKWTWVTQESRWRIFAYRAADRGATHAAIELSGERNEFLAAK